MPLPSPKKTARIAGLLYLVIIVCGIGGEAFVRAPLHAGTAGETVANLVAAELPFRLSILADMAMALADVGLGVLLYFLLKPVSSLLSMAAAAFRLAQAAILGLNLVHLNTAINLATMEVFGEQREMLVTSALESHAAGYDLGLFFFAINCMLVGVLVYRSRYIARAIGVLIGASGFVYLVGSTLRFVVPELATAFAPAYGLPLIAELGFCGWLLIKGIRSDRWAEVVSNGDFGDAGVK